MNEPSLQRYPFILMKSSELVNVLTVRKIHRIRNYVVLSFVGGETSEYSYETIMERDLVFDKLVKLLAFRNEPIQDPNF